MCPYEPGSRTTCMQRFQSSDRISCVERIVGILGDFQSESYTSSISRIFAGSKGEKVLAALIGRENASGAGSCCGSIEGETGK